MQWDRDEVVRWAPRVLGIGVSLFVGAFALDAFSQGLPFAQALPDFLMHALPGIVLLAAVALAWHREWLGACAFIGAAALYAVMAPDRTDWILAIAGPLLLTGLLFLAGWVQRRRRAVSA